MMDNRLFNVNGKGLEMLEKTLELVFAQEGTNTSAKAWVVEKDKGLVLMWYADDKSQKFVAPHDAKAAAQVAWLWLKSAEVWESTVYEQWEGDYDHDGDNSRGWRVYCEDWGHVGDHHSAICAIKPCHLWYGK